MSEKLPLLWHSNASWSVTGYGSQTALFAPRLKPYYDVTISAFYGLEGAPLSHMEIPTFPGLAGTYGNETVPLHTQRVFKDGRGLVFTLMDVWVLDENIWKGIPTASWVPVDHEPAPPMVEEYFLKTDAVPIAMSRFGEKLLEDYEPLYCPHGVDLKDYRPLSKNKSRDEVKLPKDKFVVGMVAANKGHPSRKAFPQAMMAFKAFSERHDDALLYLHTEMMGRFEGLNLPALIRSLGLEDKVALTDQYRYMFAPIQPDKMAHIYSALDVLLSPSMGEGFGLPILEAQACGVPAIVTDFSAMSEVCGAGWKVAHRPFWSLQASWQADPVIEDIVEALEHCYSMPTSQRKELGKQARNHAKQYEVEKVLNDYMLPALEESCERLGLKAPDPIAA